MPEVSDASSLRGGRSNRASHQSRPRRLTPPRADASRIRPSPRAAADDLGDRGLRGHHANRHLPKSPASQRPNSALGRAKQLQSGGICRETRDLTSDDQRRSSRIRPQVRRRSIIPCKTALFTRTDRCTKSGVTATYGGGRAVRAFGARSRSRTSGSNRESRARGRKGHGSPTQVHCREGPQPDPTLCGKCDKQPRATHFVDRPSLDVVERGAPRDVEHTIVVDLDGGYVVEGQ